MSEKILFTSDLHLTKDLLRITTCVNYLEYLKNYCLEHNIKHVVLGGDLFHQSNSIKQQSFIPFFNKLFELSQSVRLYIFVGNHEMLNHDRDSLLEAFKPFSHFIKNSETIEIGGIKYDFLSYSENPEDLPKNATVLFTHIETAEALPEEVREKKINHIFTLDSFDGYDLVVSGHIHKMAQYGKIVFPGSPYSTRKGEQGHHYFCVVEGDKYELVEYSDAPDYLITNLKEVAENIKNKNYDIYNNKIVEIKIDTKIETFVQLRQILIEHGAVDINAKFEQNEVNPTIEASKIDTNEGVAPSFVKYIKQLKTPSDISNEKLLDCFKNILSNAKE